MKKKFVLEGFCSLPEGISRTPHPESAVFCADFGDKDAMFRPRQREIRCHAPPSACRPAMRCHALPFACRAAKRCHPPLAPAKRCRGPGPCFVIVAHYARNGVQDFVRQVVFTGRNLVRDVHIARGKIDLVALKTRRNPAIFLMGGVGRWIAILGCTD